MCSKTNSKMGNLELENESEDEEIQDISDSDICDSEEIDRLFNESENITEKVIANNTYILHIGASRETNPNIAIALSDYSCGVYNLSNNRIAKTTDLPDHTNKIVDSRFSKIDSNLLYVGSSDGSIKLWDLRTPKTPVTVFEDSTNENGNIPKEISCFDTSPNDRLLSAGTDLSEGDAFLMFWDTRYHKFMGGYWESHTDDITQVKFHPTDNNKLISGSTDGLINVYDLSQQNEEDALIDTLNTESSIEQLLWFKEDGKDNISCVTHTADLQLWNVDGAEPYKHFKRSDIAEKIRKKSEDYVYVAKTHNADNSLLVLAGSNFKNGDCFRGVQIKNGHIYPAMGFPGNKQRVRGSWFNENTNILLTGGEKGILNVWKLKPLTGNFAITKRKA